MRLQTILFPTEAICSAEELYLHRREKWIDFDGYFNLFYVEKHKKYCRLEGLRLIVQLKGASRLCLMHNRTILQQLKLDDKAPTREYMLVFPMRAMIRLYFGFPCRQNSPSFLSFTDILRALSRHPRLSLSQL